MSSSDLCEVRVPTYRRPEWLRRALQSLIDQTHDQWVAIVMDDSPQAEGGSIVRDLGDARILYRKNAQHMGPAGNIDQAFADGALMGGMFACVLEDDNWMLPDCLEANVRTIDVAACPFLMRNQRIAEANGLSDKTTLGDLYREGRIEPRALHARLFFGLGAANGALFWRTDAKSRLRVGPTVTDTVLQEHCRTLQIGEVVWFAHEPLSVWSAPQGGAMSIHPAPRRLLSRGRQSVHRHLWRRYGQALMPELFEVAQRSGLERRLEENLAYIGVRAARVPMGRFMKWRIKSALRTILVPDPLRAYFASRDEH